MKQLNSKKTCFPRFYKILVIQPIAQVYGEGNERQLCKEIDNIGHREYSDGRHYPGFSGPMLWGRHMPGKALVKPRLTSMKPGNGKALAGISAANVPFVSGQ